MGKVLAKKQYSDYELQLIGEGIAKEQQVDRIVSVVLAGLGITLAVASFFVGGTLLGIALKAGMAIGGTAVGLIDAGRELAESNERKKLVYAGLYGTELTDEGLHEVDVGLMASILLFGVELFSILDAVNAFRLLNKMGTLSNDLIDIPELRRLLQSNSEYVDAHLCLKKAGYVRPEMYSPDNYRVLNETLEYAKNKGFTNDSIIEILQHNRDRGHQNLAEFLERLKRKMADAGDAQKNLKLLREALPSDHPIQWSIFDNTTKPMQDHHWIHQSMVKHHPLAKRAQELDVDIVTAEWNIDRIPHQG